MWPESQPWLRKSRSFDFCIVWSFIKVYPYSLHCEIKWHCKALLEYRFSQGTSLISLHPFSLLAFSFPLLPPRDPVQLTGIEQIFLKYRQRIALTWLAEQVSSLPPCFLYEQSYMQSLFSSSFSPKLQKTPWAEAPAGEEIRQLYHRVPGGNSVILRSEVVEGGESKTPLFPPTQAWNLKAPSAGQTPLTAVSLSCFPHCTKTSLPAWILPVMFEGQ